MEIAPRRDHIINTSNLESGVHHVELAPIVVRISEQLRNVLKPKKQNVRRDGHAMTFLNSRGTNIEQNIALAEC